MKPSVIFHNNLHLQPVGASRLAGNFSVLKVEKLSQSYSAIIYSSSVYSSLRVWEGAFIEGVSTPKSWHRESTSSMSGDVKDALKSLSVSPNHTCTCTSLAIWDKAVCCWVMLLWPGKRIFITFVHRPQESVRTKIHLYYHLQLIVHPDKFKNPFLGP